jgi:predicted metalloprotease
MRWRGGRRSGNIIDNRGSGGGLGGGLGRMGGGGFRFPGGMGGGGLPGMGGGRGGLGRMVLIIVAILVISYLVNRFGGETQTPQTQTGDQAFTPGEDEAADFIAVVLGDTEDVWNALFATWGENYAEPQLVLFTGGTQSGCGFADAAVGPFYCPGDRRVYLDLSFFDALATRYNAAGDFAQAYVVAHEVGHHVQNLLGILPEANQRQQAASEAEANEISVQVELMADCFAGVWAHHAQAERQILEPGDIEEALAAASAVGDDTLQQRSQGYVVPESFTHGTAAQRMQWFKTGFDTGDPEACNTFGG